LKGGALALEREQTPSRRPTVANSEQQLCDGTGPVTNLVTNKKALASEGFNDKQVLDLVGCGGKI
jgi:hypothetical protein